MEYSSSAAGTKVERWRLVVVVVRINNARNRKAGLATHGPRQYAQTARNGFKHGTCRQSTLDFADNVATLEMIAGIERERFGQ